MIEVGSLLMFRLFRYLFDVLRLGGIACKGLMRTTYGIDYFEAYLFGLDLMLEN